MGRTLDQLRHARSLRLWRKAAARAASAALPELARDRRRAEELRRHLDDFLATAEAHLAQPKSGGPDPARPHGSDWAWRPEPWRHPLAVPGLVSPAPRTALGDGVQVFHDCPRAELCLRQSPGTAPGDPAAYGLRLDVLAFGGSFLSLTVDLPAEAAAGLSRSHLLQVGSLIEAEHPLKIFARLNIEHGPNTEQLLSELPQPEQPGTATVEFDLAYSQLNEKRTGKIWLDLIFDAPQMNRIILRDLTFARLRRAAI